MGTIEKIALNTSLGPGELWSAAAQVARDWMHSRGVAVRDAIVLVPFAQLLPAVRAGFAAAGGWMPRVETTHTLAASLAPPPIESNGGPSGDPALDRLTAAAMLRSQSWARDWALRDGRGFAHGATALVEAAQTLSRGAAAIAPSERQAWWAGVRATCGVAGADVGAVELALLRIAVEWAAIAAAPTTDALFVQRPSAWLAIEAGGADPVAHSVLAHTADQGIAALSLVADAAGDDAFAVDWPQAGPQRRLLPDAESEAMAAAAAVIDAVERGTTPVALIAEDRLLARRVRALLERAGVPVDDETGWTLATTRAAAHVMSLLRAAAPHAGADLQLDWLKNDLDPGERAALIELEICWRQGRQGRPADSVAAADALWGRERARLEPLVSPARRPLGAWLAALRELLSTSAAAAHWREDPAGRQLRSVLRLDADDRLVDPAWADAARTSMDSIEFTAWVDGVLDQSNFVPPARDAPVTLTPLARAILRPFAAVVLPGADEMRLGPGAPAVSLLADAMLRRLGLPDRQARWHRQAQCFVALLRAPGVTLLRRAAEGDEPLAPSPLVERLLLSRRSAGLAAEPEQRGDLAQHTLAPTPVMAPQPVIGERLPDSLSASAVQALRECPYRFFARTVMRLRETEELEAEPDKRDYGIWLHAALQRFHDSRTQPQALQVEAERLIDVALRTLDELGMDRAALLPYRAGLPALARRYIVWLHRRDADGWRYAAGEQDLRSQPPELRAVGLHGRIDRIDSGSAQAMQLIDYKTGSLASLKQHVREPLEDTQLAFYAALMAERLQAGQALSAGYLALDDGDEIDIVEHRNVQASAVELVDGLALDLQHMREGAALQALGAPPVCDRCDVRGLCRRDHWAPPEGGS